MATFEGVYNSGGKCQIRWMEDRRRSKVLPIPFTPNGIAKAYKIRAQFVQAWAAGTPAERGECPTFQHFAKVKLASASWRPASVKAFRHNMNKHWSEFGHRPINTLHYDELLDHFAPLLSGQASPNQLRSIFYSGSSVFRLAIKAGWIRDNVARMLIEDIGPSTKKIDTFTPAERDQLLPHFTGNFLLYWTIRFYMGLRPGEVLALKWPDVRGVFSVTKSMKDGVFGPTKTGVDREVPVHPRVAALLKIQPRRFDCDALLVSEAGDHYRESARFNRQFRNALKQEGIRYRSPYNARHTCAAMMLTGGMQPAVCAEFLGHSLKTFFDDYASIIAGAGIKTQADIWAGLE